MRVLNDLSFLYKQYQTRRQLLHLPEHLLLDIAVTKEMTHKELQKNKLFPLLAYVFHTLIKGK